MRSRAIESAHGALLGVAYCTSSLFFPTITAGALHEPKSNRTWVVSVLLTGYVRDLSIYHCICMDMIELLHQCSLCPYMAIVLASPSRTLSGAPEMFTVVCQFRVCAATSVLHWLRRQGSWSKLGYTWHAPCPENVQ